MNPPRPRPRLDAENRAFWTGGTDNRLCIAKCADCGQFTHPPKLMCRHCLSENIAPAAVAGTGEIDTLTINYQAWAPGLEVPLVIALFYLSPLSLVLARVVGMLSGQVVRRVPPVKVAFNLVNTACTTAVAALIVATHPAERHKVTMAPISWSHAPTGWAVLLGAVIVGLLISAASTFGVIYLVQGQDVRHPAVDRR